jgi:hypothetical protein
MTSIAERIALLLSTISGDASKILEQAEHRAGQIIEERIRADVGIHKEEATRNEEMGPFKITVTVPRAPTSREWDLIGAIRECGPKGMPIEDFRRSFLVGNLEESGLDYLEQISAIRKTDFDGRVELTPLGDALAPKYENNQKDQNG